MLRILSSAIRSGPRAPARRFFSSSSSSSVPPPISALRSGPRAQARRFFSSVPPPISSVCVVGAGTLGTQVSLQVALSGFEVAVLDVSQASLDKCRETHAALARQYVYREASGEQARAWISLASKETPASEVASSALARLSYTTSAEEACAECDLVSENVPEVPEIKAATYAQLHEFAPAHAIFTTNSSTLLPSQFAESTGRPSQFLSLHFANGIWDANIGEVMPHPGTSPEATAIVFDFAQKIGMVPFKLNKEHNGYLINALLVPWLNASVTLVERGVSAPVDVDRAWLISTGGFAAPPGAVRGPVSEDHIPAPPPSPHPPHTDSWSHPADSFHQFFDACSFRSWTSSGCLWLRTSWSTGASSWGTRRCQRTAPSCTSITSRQESTAS